MTVAECVAPVGWITFSISFIAKAATFDVVLL